MNREVWFLTFWYLRTTISNFKMKSRKNFLNNFYFYVAVCLSQLNFSNFKNKLYTYQDGTQSSIEALGMKRKSRITHLARMYLHNQVK